MIRSFILTTVPSLGASLLWAERLNRYLAILPVWFLSLRFSLLGALLMVVSIAVLINAGSADQTVTVTTTVGLTSCVSTQTTAVCGGPPASYVQVLELLLLLVLILAAVVAIYLIKLYRRTRF